MTKLSGKFRLVLLDLREEKIIYASTVFTIGKSIFNKTSKANIGALMLEYLGGGHENAGTCQIQNEKSEDILKEITEKLLDN